ncbi:MAG: tetratricopeptide repeat protein [Candidatus Sumerlaeaceae bacterium]|nr:tetratricopeptide repeat protein [Candidatus Sumerlaeaceae bacterium]
MSQAGQHAASGSAGVAPAPFKRRRPSRRSSKHKERLSRLSRGGRDWKPAALGVLVLLVAWAVFLPVLRLGFTSWDDADYVTRCPYIKYLTWENVRFFFTQFYFSNYHPLTSLTYMLEYWLWRVDARGYHAVNLVLHGFNAVWVYVLGRRLVGRPWVAAAAALLYAVHPQRVEVVAWIAARKDLLCAFFALPCLIVYLHYARTGAQRALWGAFVLHVLALLSKPMAVSVPVVLLALDWFAGRKMSWRLLLEKWAFFVVSLIMGLVTIAAQRSGGSIRLDLALDWWVKLQTAAYGFVFYLGKFVWPHPLSPLYAYGVEREDILPAPAFFGPQMLMAAAAVALYLAARSRVWAFAVAMYVIMLLPVIQIVPVGGAYASDRYTYLPMVGLTIALCHSAATLVGRLSKGWRVAALTAGMVILAAAATASIRYTLVWKNGLTLWEHAIRVNPRSQVAFNNLATEYIERGDHDKGLLLLNRAVTLYPAYAHAFNNRGNCYSARGDSERAAADYKTAISIAPYHAPPYNNLGSIYGLQGKLNDALEMYSLAISKNPFYSEAYLNRAAVLGRLGRLEEALSDMLTAVEINPNLPIAYNDLGNTLANLGRMDEAEKMFYLALRYDPGNPVFLMNRGSQRKSAGRLREAISDFEQAAPYLGKSEQLYNNWGGALAEMGDHAAAIPKYNKAIEINPSSAPAYCNRATSYYKLGDFERARADFDKALELYPSMPMALKGRGILRSTLQDISGAIEDFTKALEASPDFVDALINRAANYYILRQYDKAWADVRRLRELKVPVREEFIRQLQEASGVRE